MVRTQLPWGQRGPLEVEPETVCTVFPPDQRVVPSFSPKGYKKQYSWRELRLKEAPLFFKVLFVMVLWPLLMIGWIMYWSGRK